MPRLDASRLAISRRKLILDKLEELCKVKRTHLYEVRRGIVDWPSFPFDRFPNVISIMTDETSFLREVNTGAFTLEIMSRLPKGVDQSADVNDKFLTDAAEIFEELEMVGANNGDGDSLILRVDRTKDIAIQVAEPFLGIQGLIATTFIEY